MDGMSMSGMTMSTSAAPTSTMTGMSMASSSSSSMDMSATTLMGMDSMAMTFFTSTGTPLFSSSWTPTSTGQYAGTCIFLIALATIFRALLAARVNFFGIWAMVRQGHDTGDRTKGFIMENKPTRRPWRANEAVAIAFLDLILGGVAYLLMIAVMTMNVGYFLSVLAGIFLGSLAFNPFLAHTAAH